MDRRDGERLLLRLGDMAAIADTVMQMAAGSSQSALLGAEVRDAPRKA